MIHVVDPVDPARTLCGDHAGDGTVPPGRAAHPSMLWRIDCPSCHLGVLDLSDSAVAGHGATTT